MYFTSFLLKIQYIIILNESLIHIIDIGLQQIYKLRINHSELLADYDIVIKRN